VVFGCRGGIRRFWQAVPWHHAGHGTVIYGPGHVWGRTMGLGELPDHPDGTGSALAAMCLGRPSSPRMTDQRDGGSGP
jgi:hypothetical protein